MAIWTSADQLKLKKEIAALLARPSQAITERSANARTEPTLGNPDYANFDILNDERSWDLRDWKDLSLPENAQAQSFMTMTPTTFTCCCSSGNRVEDGQPGDRGVDARSEGGKSQASPPAIAVLVEVHVDRIAASKWETTMD